MENVRSKIVVVIGVLLFGCGGDGTGTRVSPTQSAVTQSTSDQVFPQSGQAPTNSGGHGSQNEPGNFTVTFNRFCGFHPGQASYLDLHQPLLVLASVETVTSPASTGVRKDDRFIYTELARRALPVRNLTRNFVASISYSGGEVGELLVCEGDLNQTHAGIYGFVSVGSMKCLLPWSSREKGSADQTSNLTIVYKESQWPGTQNGNFPSDPDCDTSGDPLILNLSGKPVGLSSAAESHVRFDYIGNKNPIPTGWVTTGDTAFLTLPDAKGAVSSGKELFGDAMALLSGRFARDGFEALAQFDQDKNGAITPKDPIFKNLRLWKDANTNGRAETVELVTLLSEGIDSISVKPVEVNEVDRHGNRTVLRAPFERKIKGVSIPGLVFDVLFRLGGLQ